VSLSCTYLPYSETNAFSHLVIDYLSHSENLKPFYHYTPDKAGIRQAIADRKKFPVDRRQLVSVLQEQYKDLHQSEALQTNLQLLQEENTFTICTAHQPNLLTGYLYFVYKIVHAIKLAKDLKADFPEHNFVPVYYIGSEDNDLDELGTFRYNGQKFVWDAAGQTGAVGRMTTESLKPLLHDLLKQLGPPGDFCEELHQIITTAYLQHTTISAATIYLVNELFGRFGLVVIDPDHRSLKAAFTEGMKDDLLNQTPNRIVVQQMESLAAHHKTQAHPRSINLFYLKDDLRERIEKQSDGWGVVNSNIRWSEDALLEELEQYPERFSPNVILRGLFQETILPNIAFIGGGSEVAYWLQLKTLFEHYEVFYPVIFLRQSVLWVTGKEGKLRQQLELSISNIFKPETELIHEFVKKNSVDDWQVDNEMKALEQLLGQLKQKAVVVDPTLRASADAALARMRHQVQVLEKKMLRAEKRKLQDRILKIAKLKDHLFPKGSLQERTENFMPFYLIYGKSFFDALMEYMAPLQQQFLVIEDHH
jgi:bacillithiol biosynthesis cysteine-adding enzyme BshC